MPGVVPSPPTNRNRCVSRPSANVRTRVSGVTSAGQPNEPSKKVPTGLVGGTSSVPPPGPRSAARGTPRIGPYSNSICREPPIVRVSEPYPV